MDVLALYGQEYSVSFEKCIPDKLLVSSGGFPN